MKQFVQFMHQGIEHGPKWGKQWNPFGHKRKFMMATGEIWDEKAKRAIPHKELLFWGEWEAQSVCYTIGKTCPKYRFSPYLDLSVYPTPIPPKSKGLQTTDPLVFADHFYYSTCKQVDKNYRSHPTLTTLDCGSVILFGSRKWINSDWRFVLDTVFVVKEFRDYTDSTYRKDLAGFIPKNYPQLAHLDPSTHPTSQKRCYHGATPENPCEGMFSFVPCKIHENGPQIVGFERPILDFSWISQDLQQGIKILHDGTSSFSKMWQEVKDEVVRQGFELGIRFRINNKIDSI